MSKTCKRAKFCSAEHLSQAKLRAAKQARGGRESLTAQQVAHLFRVMLEDLSSAWTAVFLLLCIYLGKRCGCTLSARDSWFSGLSSAQPLVRLPKVNAKTTEREIPLEPEFAKLLLHWSQTGLEGTAGSRWPHAGQKLQLEEPVRGKGRLLFPGRKAGGKNLRNYAKPVTGAFTTSSCRPGTSSARSKPPPGLRGLNMCLMTLYCPGCLRTVAKKQLSRYSKNMVWQQAWYHS